MATKPYKFALISGTAPSGFNWQVFFHDWDDKYVGFMNFKTHKGMDLAMAGFNLKLSKGGAKYN